VPTAQSTHPADPEYLPAEHDEQLAAPALEEEEPAGQGEHEAESTAPAVPKKRPAAQLKQLD